MNRDIGPAVVGRSGTVDSLLLAKLMVNRALARQLPWILPILFVGGLILTLLPYYGFFDALLSGLVSVPATTSLFFMRAVFGCIAVFFQQSWYIAFLNPLRELGWWWIMVRSLVIYHQKGIVWRGRSYRGKN